jgi:hypothetical protein
MKSSTGSARRRKQAENRRMSAERRQKRAKDVRTWRSAAGGSIVLMLVMTGIFLLGTERAARPVPAREHLYRFGRTVFILLCVPFALIVVVYLWKELLHRLINLADRA